MISSSDLDPVILREQLIRASLASYIMDAEDGYRTIVMRTNEEAADLVLDVLGLEINVDP